MKKHLFLTSIAFTLATISSALGQAHAYLWDPTTGIRDLGTLGDDSIAYAVKRQAASWLALTSQLMAAFTTTGLSGREATGMVDIGVPGGGDSNTAEVFCFAINNAGDVVGSARQVDGRQVAFFWSPTDGFTVLGDISTNSDNGNSAYAINDLDQVTGNLVVNKRGIIYHAFLWSPGMAHPRDLGVVEGAQYSLGNGINNLTRIAGGSLAAGDVWEPMSWTKKKGMRIGLFPGPFTR